MFTKYYYGAMSVLFLIACSAVVAMLFLSEPQIARNSGTHERLKEELKTIGKDLVAADNGLQKLDALDFIARGAEQQGDRPGTAPKLLAKRHGTTLPWYRNKAVEEVFFYPIAIAPEITIDPWSNAAPTPQIVMVPVEQVDRETLPNLHGCGNVTGERLRKCQLRRIRKLFVTHGMVNAATLMSDGYVVYMPVDDLCGGVGGTE